LGICVQDGWQGLGIGRTLMARIIAEAKELGKFGLQLTVMQDNLNAVALYQSVGFIIDGDAPDSMGSSYHMTLQLAGGET
jgi:ribosomal protein S18 acetylase RimI-like enzyme